MTEKLEQLAGNRDPGANEALKPARWTRPPAIGAPQSAAPAGEVPGEDPGETASESLAANTGDPSQPGECDGAKNLPGGGTGGAPDSADETASLENVLDLTRRICARLGKEPDVNLAELSGKVDKLTLAMEKFASGAKKTGAALDKVLAAQKTVTGEAAKLLEEGDRKVTADFHRWAATQRRYRFRLSALALAVAVPAFFVLGVLLEQQFQIVPLHDPTSGWSAHIWQNYGRTIVDCAEDARRTNKPIECRFLVHAP